MGEVAFLTVKPATATVVAQSDVRALVFEKNKLNLFFRSETEVAGLIYQLLGRELAHKMKVSNSLLSAASATADTPVSFTEDARDHDAPSVCALRRQSTVAITSSRLKLAGF